MVELAAQFSAALSRITTQSAKLPCLPKGCSFTVAIELREPPFGQAPLDNDVTWLPAEPGLQPEAKGKHKVGMGATVNHAGHKHGAKRQLRGEYLGVVRTTAIRSVEAGAFIMEIWVEEGKEKLGSSAPNVTLGGQPSSNPSVAKHVTFEDKVS